MNDKKQEEYRVYKKETKRNSKSNINIGSISNVTTNFSCYALL